MIESKLTMDGVKVINNYPFLGITTRGVIVLFTSHGVGAIVHCSDADNAVYSLGERKSTWDMNCFTAFTGSIHLRNKVTSG